MSISLIFVFNRVSAEPVCPNWATLSEVRLEASYRFRQVSGGEIVGTGPRFDSASYFRSKGIGFELPLGYWNPWPPTDMARQIIRLETNLDKHVNDRNDRLNTPVGAPTPGLDWLSIVGPEFSFWMPSLRYVERDRKKVSSFRPCEAGRGSPSVND